MPWFKVVSLQPISVDYQNGQVVSLHKGCYFEATVDLPDVQRYARLVPPRIVNLGASKPVTSADAVMFAAPQGLSMSKLATKPAPAIPPGIDAVVRSVDRAPAKS